MYFDCFTCSLSNLIPHFCNIKAFIFQNTYSQVAPTNSRIFFQVIILPNSNINKTGNIVPIHKKNDKQNCRPVSLLPICGKSFKRLNESFRFLLENKLITPHQSDFKPGDSCINQLLSITHEI